MKLQFLSLSCFLLVTGFITGCKTTADLVRTKPYVDPTGVKTLDSEPVISSKPTNGVGQDLEDLKRENAMLRGETEELRVALENAQKSSGSRVAELEEQNRKLAEELLKIRDSGALPTPPTRSGEVAGSASAADKLWDLALKDVASGQYLNAKKAFGDFFKSYPRDPRAPQALIGQGFAQYGSKEFDQAALTFNQLIDKFPKRRQAAMAWFGQAASFAQLGQRQDAKLFFDEVRKRFPRTSEAILAARQIEKKDKLPEDLFKVFPKWASKP
jgi:TolA-binding protein